MAQGLHDRFDRSGSYVCESCGHRTRRVGDEPVGTCNNCYELAGLENLISDTGHLTHNQHMMYVQYLHIFNVRRAQAGRPFAHPVPYEVTQ